MSDQPELPKPLYDKAPPAPVRFLDDGTTVPPKPYGLVSVMPSIAWMVYPPEDRYA